MVHPNPLTTHHIITHFNVHLLYKAWLYCKFPINIQHIQSELVSMRSSTVLIGKVWVYAHIIHQPNHACNTRWLSDKNIGTKNNSMHTGHIKDYINIPVLDTRSFAYTYLSITLTF